MRMDITFFSSFFILILIRLVQCQWPSGCKEDRAINDTCYLLSSTATSYSHAERNCTLEGGTLAIIKDAETNSKISSIVKKDTIVSVGQHFPTVSESSRIWIGLNDRTSEGKFRYLDDTELLRNNYQPWASNQPSSSSRYAAVEDCVSLNAYSQQWYDDRCSQNKKFICQYKAKPCNTQNITVANFAFDNCYTTSEIHYNFNISIKCHEGYILIGSSNVTCLSNGEWSQLPICLKGCKPPPRFTNANITVAKDYYVVGDVASYICSEGYFSNIHPEKTHFTITCSTNGNWLPSRSGCSHVKSYKLKGMEINANDSITLICDIHNSNNVDKKNDGMYIWLKDSNNLSNTQIEYIMKMNGDLVIYDNSTENIEGLYMCFQLREKIIPGNTVYDLKHVQLYQCDDDTSSNITQYVYNEGASGFLMCPHNSSYVGFHWFKDGEYLPLNDNHVFYPDGSLYIRQIEFSHQGTYTCMMTVKDTFCSKNSTAEVKVMAAAESICGDLSKSTVHPWTVSLWWKDEVVPFCYGALINERWIITSAQCVSGLYRKRNMNVIARFSNGSIRAMNSEQEEGNEFENIPVEMAKIHPLFSKKRYINDIGLVKLNHSVLFSENIQPICFTPIDLTNKTQCDQSPPINGIATGWGSLERDDAGEISLQEENMTIVAPDTCFPTDSHYTDKILCFKKTSEAKETFAGDSGSPIEVIWKGRVYLLGIYSWGDRIARLGEYDYYTKVSNYVPWILTFLNVE